MSKSCQNGGQRGQKLNERKFPGLSGARPDRAKQKQEAAAQRQAEYAKLSNEEKALRNPRKFEKVI